MSPSSTSATDNSFKGLGYQFIALRRAHLDFLGYVFGEAPPPVEECIGRTLVDRDFRPAGFCLAWLRPDDTVTIHAYFGDYLRRYPKDILRGMKPIMERIRQAGIVDVYAEADERFEGSRKLIEWFGGVPTGQRVENGEYYRIDMTRSPI
jgi:RimJ/RimL family protein N-acetyltransferase